MSEPRQIAVVRSYDELLEAIRARAMELGATRSAIDEVAGLPTRQTAKLLALGSSRKMTLETMLPIACALGLAVALVEDAEALAKHASRLGIGSRPYILNGVQNAPVILKFSKRRMKKIAKLSAAGRLLKISPERRSEIARHAINARWRKAKEQAASISIHQSNEGALPKSKIHVNARGRLAKTSQPQPAFRSEARTSTKAIAEGRNAHESHQTTRPVVRPTQGARTQKQGRKA